MSSLMRSVGSWGYHVRVHSRVARTTPAGSGSHDWLLENVRSRIGLDIHGAIVLVIDGGLLGAAAPCAGTTSEPQHRRQDSFAAIRAHRRAAARLAGDQPACRSSKS
jgi:hypothetical protein